MFVCVYVYVYVYMYIHTHTSQAVSAKLKNTNGEALCPRRLESLSCESLSPVLSPNRHGDGILQIGLFSGLAARLILGFRVCPPVNLTCFVLILSARTRS